MFTVGCRPEATVHIRFIEEEPLQTVEDGLPIERVPVFEWAIADSVWTPGPDPNPPIVNRSCDFDAETVDSIVVKLEGLPIGQLKLFWQRDGGEYIDELTLQAEHMASEGPLRVFPFDVTTHRNWSGRITGLRVYTHQDQRPAVRGAQLLAYHTILRPEKEREAAASAWRVSLGQDLRTALLGLPSHPIERTLVVPDRARIQLAYGIRGTVRGPVTFRIVAQSGEERDVLFKQTLDEEDPERDSWHEVDVSLSRHAGKEIRLTLETETQAPVRAAAGAPVWASPEVWRRGRDDQRYNLILISVDTLRADHLSAYGYERSTSPRLDAWAASNAVVFEQAIAQAPTTLPSHTSMLTGVDALRHGTNHQPAQASLTTLAELLRAEGYATLARTGGGYLHPRYGLHQGFDAYRYWLYGHDRDAELEDGIDASLRWIERYQDRPFFLFLHTYEVHAPYRPRQPHFSSFTSDATPPDGLVWMVYEEPRADQGFRAVRYAKYRVRSEDPSDDPTVVVETPVARALYDSSIAYVDEQLARVLAQVQRLGLEGRTLVVVTSDHGEAFGEQGLAGHGYLYDSNLHVPLLLALPGGQQAGRRISEQVRSVDIVPTLAELMGFRQPDGLDGESLLPLLAGTGHSPREAWTYAANDNHGVSLRLGGRLKYIFNNSAWAPLHGREELYRLGTDPGELTSDAQGRELGALRRRLGEVLRSAPGVRIRLANGSTLPFRGSVASPDLSPTRVKLEEVEPCGCITWATGQGLLFDLPPGTTATLVLEAEGGDISLTHLAVDGSSSTIELVAPDAPLLGRRKFHWTGEAFALSGGPDEPFPTSVEIWREGLEPSTALDYRTEPELMRQLQALGYVR